MNYKIGDFVSISLPLPFLKTADPMPMLRPPDLVSSDEIGQIVALRSLGIVEVQFRRGRFLIPVDRLDFNRVEENS